MKPTASLIPLLAAVLTLATAVPTTGHTEPTLEKAEQLFQERKFEEAVLAFDALTKQNPYQGFPWFRKGLALLRLQRFPEAINAYLESERLGSRPRWTAAGLGFCYMELDDVDEAARWFEQSVTIDPEMMEKLDSPGLRAFLGPERAASIFGPETDEAWSQMEGWRTDLDFFAKVIRRSHFDFDVKTSSDVWEKRIRLLNERLPSLEDEEIALELAKLAALAGDGHTNIWPQFHDGLTFHMLPLLLYPFEDGVFVRAAAPEHAELVGARVTRIGEVDIESLINGVAPYHGHENPMHNLLLLPYELGTVEVLKQLGATDSVQRVQLTLVGEAGSESSRIVESIPWLDSWYGAKLSAPDWVHMNEDVESATPLWLRRPNDIYWFEFFEDEQIIYFHYDQIHNKEAEAFAEFAKRLFELVKKHPNAALVIDLRMNDGGSSDLYPPLIQQIIAHPEINREGKLFAIIGRMTYSAAMNLAVDLENWTETIFVGEPTGSSPNFIGENKRFTLPYSGLSVSVSDRYHQHAGSTDRRIWIPPDLVAEMTADAFSRNEDPALNRIVDYLGRHRSGNAESSK